MKLFLIPTPLADDTSADVLSAQVSESVKNLDVFLPKTYVPHGVLLAALNWEKSLIT